MKKYFLIILVLFVTLHSCKEKPEVSEKETEISQTEDYESDSNQEKTPETTEESEPVNLVSTKIDNSVHYTQKDSVTIETGYGDMVFSREEFNEIVDKHPEFFLDEVVDPKTSLYKLNKQVYGELGGNQYFSFYAYFLRKRYDFELYKEEKDKLRGIYYNLLNFGSFISGGGSYYTHEKGRLAGYVEYDAYLLDKKGRPSTKPNFEDDKKAHMDYLRDAVKIGRKNGFGRGDLFANEAEIDEFEGRLHKILDTIESEITDRFYLDKAKEFYDPKNFGWYKDNQS